MPPSTNLQDWFGAIDIYLFDLVLKGRITPEMKLLDAGCGGGRNLTYFFRTGFDVSGVDQSAAAIAEIQSLAASLAPNLPAGNFGASEAASDWISAIAAADWSTPETSKPVLKK